MAGNRQQVEKGFTLIELAVVVLIIAVIATAVAPHLDSLSPKYSLRAGAREIASHIEQCRSQSIIEGKTYSLVYDINNNRYWMLLPQEFDEYGEPIDDKREPVLPKRSLPRGVIIVEIITPDDASHTSGELQFDLSPFGNTGSHIIVVQYRDDEKMRIWVRANALLGFTTFHYEETGFIEYEPEADDESYGQQQEQEQQRQVK
jgi:prepilin-type N-terminal cleavage/methylation domain-containing protein